MNKKKTIFIVILFLALGYFYSLGKETDLSDPQAVINSFMKKMINGNLEDALQYCDEKSSAYEKLESVSEEKIVQMIAEELVSDKDARNSLEENENLKDFFHIYYKYLYKSYEINNIDEEDNTITCELSVEKIDWNYDVLFDFSNSKVFNDYFNQYNDELEEMSYKDGLDAVYVKFLSDRGKKLAEEKENEIKEKATYTTYIYIIELELIDDCWYVTRYDRQ